MFANLQPAQCSNQQCSNRNRFQLDIYESSFIDFQASYLDVIVRGELVETVQPGDRCDFVGTLIVIPDVAQLSAPGLRAQVTSGNRRRGLGSEQEGVTGLKALGVRDMNYKLAFLACNVTSSIPSVKFNVHFIHGLNLCIFPPIFWHWFMTKLRC
ncbi:unnamed protein product [Gongylonema pulchrum]|uniref:DNA replication licensing factor MCM6 n=1 Tax=Gongylonema pulchrum TaxID=637853 RepID=A0A183DJR9_9BILA|nr:unnamed protein product [Gongylonema pulchrum]